MPPHGGLPETAGHPPKKHVRKQIKSAGRIIFEKTFEMPRYLIHASIMPLEALLDPQGKAVERGLHALGIEAAEQVRVGKQIRFQVEAESKTAAEAMAEKACTSLLANAVMEYYVFRIEPC
jgi:phosphoribosylformylglycinamidine synthase PurS subunit